MIRASVQALHAYVPGEQPRDPAVLKLNTNENPYPPAPAVLRALSAYPGENLRRYPDPQCRALRQAIAERHGCGVEQVFVGNGSDEVLALCTRAFVENNGSIGYFDPSYSLYATLAAIRDVETRPVPLGPGFAWAMAPAYEASLFFLTHPNAPTGMIYPQDELRAFCERFAGVVVLDEAYADFAQADGMALARQQPNVLAIRTFSKAFSLAGLRVGYAVGAPRLIAALFRIKDSYNLDGLAQTLALAALRDIDAMHENVARIRATRERLTVALRRMGHDVYPSETNFLWVEPTGLTAQALFERLRAERILIRYFPGPRTGACVRITIGTEEETDRLLAALERIERREF